MTNRPGKSCILQIIIILLFSLPAPQAPAQERAIDWRPLITIRFDNTDAIDSESSQLASFIRSIRNDGRFIPPLRTLIGPDIRNTTFFGLSYEGWLEGMLLAPHQPGAARGVWVFPVDSRDEYVLHLVSLGFAEYEGMDGVTVLREIDPDGGYNSWYLEWLPGNIAVFGSQREAVISARKIYEENSASRGILADAGGQYVRPDIMISLDTDVLTSWRNKDPASYWWREEINRLTSDLINFWQPSPARRRLINNLSSDFAMLPRLAERILLSLWFEDTGTEWQLDIVTDPQSMPRRSQLECFRNLPEKIALGYCAPVTDSVWRDLTSGIGSLLLNSAGGVVSAEARSAALQAYELLTRTGITQMASAWVPPPADSPNAGSNRLLIYKCSDPEYLRQAWDFFKTQIQPGTPGAQAFAQIGWIVDTTSSPGNSESIILTIRPVGAEADDQPWLTSSCSAAIGDGLAAIAIGNLREDPDEMIKSIEIRTKLAGDAVRSGMEGSSAVRGAFVRMGQQGASFIGLMDPILFLQLAMSEAADWRPLSPDHNEPAATQFAREMLEYAPGGTWPFLGEDMPYGLQYRGVLPWTSLTRLSGVLGITEVVGTD